MTCVSNSKLLASSRYSTRVTGVILSVLTKDLTVSTVYFSGKPLSSRNVFNLSSSNARKTSLDIVLNCSLVRSSVLGSSFGRISWLSITAYKTVSFLIRTQSNPILPAPTPRGNPLASLVSNSHDFPESVDLYMPVPAPDSVKFQALLVRSQMAANNTFGLLGSIVRSTAPAVGLTYNVLVQVTPPS